MKGSTRHRKVAAIKTFLRYLEKQHIPPKDFSAITHHIASKTDIKTVQGNAGHLNLATTDYYAQFVKDAQIKAMQEHAL